MKVCSKCKIEKEYSEFSKCKTRKDGHQSKCKSCEKDYEYANRDKLLKRRQSRKDGLYTVYLIVKDSYVGTTNSLHVRKYLHKCQGLDNTEYQIIGKYKVHEEALLEESRWHQKGYKGGLNKQEINKLKNYLP